MADDLLQETFYRFLRAARTHESEAHRRNPLQVATNLARDAHRRRAAPFFAPDLPDVASREDAAGLRAHDGRHARSMP